MTFSGAAAEILKMAAIPFDSGAEGKLKPYIRAGIGPESSAPEIEEYGVGTVYWFKKRLYLGRKNSQLRRLFDLLAKHPGKWYSTTTLQSVVYGMISDTSFGVAEAEVKRINQNLRKLISRLKARMAEHEVDHHATIVVNC